MSRRKPSAVSNANADGAGLWGEVVAAGAKDTSGTGDTGTAGKASPGLAPKEQKPLSSTAWKLGSIIMLTHTHTMCFGRVRSIKSDQNGFADCRHPIIFFHTNILRQQHHLGLHLYFLLFFKKENFPKLRNNSILHSNLGIWKLHQQRIDFAIAFFYDDFMTEHPPMHNLCDPSLTY